LAGGGGAKTGAPLSLVDLGIHSGAFAVRDIG
jgi:hypothetical protein